MNSPRISAGAFGFRSYISCVAAPPSRYSKMTLFAFPGGCGSLARSFGRVRAEPKSVSAPAVSASRRVTPSQVRFGEPRRVSISDSE